MKLESVKLRQLVRVAQEKPPGWDEGIVLGISHVTGLVCVQLTSPPGTEHTFWVDPSRLS